MRSNFFGNLPWQSGLYINTQGLWESRTQLPIDPAVWYIAVGLGHPGGAGAPNGWVVHPLKTYTSWVQNVARQFGSIS